MNGPIANVVISSTPIGLGKEAIRFRARIASDSTVLELSENLKNSF